MTDFKKILGTVVGGIALLYIGGAAVTSLGNEVATNSAGEPTELRGFTVQGTPQYLENLYTRTCVIPVQKSLSHNDKIIVRKGISQENPLEICLSLSDGDTFYAINYENSVVGENSFTNNEIAFNN